MVAPNKEEYSGFLAKCWNYQQVKCEDQKSGGTLQRMLVLTWKWKMIAMDVIVGLSMTLGSMILYGS